MEFKGAMSVETWKNKRGSKFSTKTTKGMLIADGYIFIGDEEYDSSTKQKPKALAIRWMNAYKVDHIVYRATTHTWGWKWLEFYIKT